MVKGGISTRSFNDGARSYDGGSADGSSGTASDLHAPVLSPIHVSCYVTAANRATPVFEVLPQRNCVRVVNKPSSDPSSGASAGGRAMTGMLSNGGATVNSGAGPLAEWELNAVFASSSPSHAIDFFTEITLPALRAARDGINANVIVWGVHPTQKFRLLFGKSVGGGGFAPQPEMAVKDVVELYGQLVGMLHAFFSQLDLGPVNSRSQDLKTEPWRLGISSWIIVNNQAIDLLRTPGGATSTSSAQDAPPVSFVSLEAPSLATAFRIVQTAKTNRIVRKHNAESVHFFVRLALFHGGQVSTLHLVDLVDQKDFQDQVLVQEKMELYNILQGLRQPLPSPRPSGGRLSIPGSGASSPMSAAGKVVLSNFMLPLLTANARTFLYANVIDSRASLRESVQMLNAVANLRGFTCVCKRLRSVSYEQLGFQTSLSELDQQELSSQDGQARNMDPITLPSYQGAQPLLNSLQHPGTSPSMLEQQCSFQQASTTAPMANGCDESEAMSWLNAFTQRKRDILGGSIDSIPTVPAPSRVYEARHVDSRLTEAFCNGDDLQQHEATPEARSSIADLYERLRESLDEVNEIDQETTTSLQTSYCSLHSLPPDRSVPKTHTPLPIVDRDTDREVFTHEGYSRSTIGGLTRHQPQQLVQQADGELSLWTMSNNAASDHPIDVTYHRYRNDVDTHTPSTGPEESSLQPTEMPPSPFSLSSPIASPLPIASQLSQLPSRAERRTLDAFKKAGVPACLMEPPKLDGLDDKTAQKIQAADATLLRKNYDALLSIVREQQQAKEAAEARAAEALHDQEEQRAMFEVQIENMKLANVGLRSKVRALENRTALPQVFEQYEQELRALHGQAQELQTRNVALELRTSGSDGIGDAPVGLSGSLSDIKKKYQQVVDEKLELEREVMEHRRRERHHQVHSRLAGESTRRVDQLSRDLNNKEEDLIATRLSKKRLSAEINQALEKADQLHHENEKLLQEKVATTEELLATRMYLASLENEKKKAAVLDRFVEKHGDRMNKLRQSGQSSLGTRGENWRRDQYARECEDKLLASVKRSLPQAVPLCNKLLRRLEMQELSLREFSEREVDFINLLVELVSDQPTLSLKQMIEHEMKKLQS